MPNRILITLALASVATLAIAASSAAPSFKVAKFEIGGDGGHDYD